MALVGSYSVGGSYSLVTLSNQYDTIDELLIQIPENTSGSIRAEDIRDSVYSLWEKIETVSASVSNFGSSTTQYDRISSTTVEVGGLPIGSTFSGSIQDALDRIFYPYISPVASITSWSQKEFGDPTGYNFNLSWTATENSNPITQIDVNGSLQTHSPLSGVVPATSTHSNTPGLQSNQVYNINVMDGISSITASTTVSWRNKIYWGILDGTTVGNPDLTSFPGSLSSLQSLVNSSTIIGLNSELSLTKNKTYTGINGGGNYLIFAWPSSVPGSTLPTFTVNGLPNTAFTSIQSAWSFTNYWGFVSNYEVWISNTIQNSPLNIIIS
jgi:hypothetical protein